MTTYSVLHWWWYTGATTAADPELVGAGAGPTLVLPEAPAWYSPEHIMDMQDALRQQDALLHKRTGDMYHPYSLTVRQRTIFPWTTLEANATEPSVAAGRNFRTANTAATSITNFAGGIDGQEITVRVDDNNTTFDFTSSNLVGNAGADYAASDGDQVRAVYDSAEGVWYCQIVSA